jgi:hypothetical protein
MVDLFFGLTTGTFETGRLCQTDELIGRSRIQHGLDVRMEASWLQ